MYTKYIKWRHKDIITLSWIYIKSMFEKQNRVFESLLIQPQWYGIWYMVCVCKFRIKRQLTILLEMLISIVMNTIDGTIYHWNMWLLGACVNIWIYLVFVKCTNVTHVVHHMQQNSLQLFTMCVCLILQNWQFDGIKSCLPFTNVT